MDGDGLKLPWSGAVAGALALAAIGFVAGNQSSKPRPIAMTPPPTAKVATAPSPQIRVHVSGAVQKPGVYAFQPEERVEDALKAAGGGLKGARIHDLNLAMKLQDEQAIFVPSADSPPVIATDAPRSKTSSKKAPPTPPAPISLRTATAEELATLPGIGPVIAERIIEFREKHGFETPNDLDLVPGISTDLCLKLLPLVRL